MQDVAKKCKAKKFTCVVYWKDRLYWTCEKTFHFATKMLIFCVDEDQHNFKSLSSLQDEINTYLQIQLKTTTEKINEVYDLDKNIWKELDDQEQTCEKLVKEIRKLRKGGVSLKIVFFSLNVAIDFII